MNQAEVERILLLESHRLIAESAEHAVKKFGQPVPIEARDDYLSPDEILHLEAISSGAVPFDDPIFQKAMAASAAQISALSYPPDGRISAGDAEALESLQLTPAQASVAQRVIAEACHSVLFSLFCLLDSVADPELTSVERWRGARFVSPRKEGPMLHDELGDSFYEYRDMTNEN
jgi:hypothetical protein